MNWVIAMWQILVVLLNAGVDAVRAIGVKIRIYKLLFLAKSMYKTWQKDSIQFKELSNESPSGIKICKNT